MQRGGQEEVLDILYDGVEQAQPAPGVLAALAQAEAIVICPSNPCISIGTILAVPGVRQALQESSAPVVAISPIVAGKTLKGPADLMLRGLGFDTSAYGVAQYYQGLLQAMIIDTMDAALQPRLQALGLRVMVTNTIMRTLADTTALAQTTLACARACRHT